MTDTAEGLLREIVADEHAGLYYDAEREAGDNDGWFWCHYCQATAQCDLGSFPHKKWCRIRRARALLGEDEA